MKRKKAWLRCIAWILLLILCMNSVGTTALAADISTVKTENRTKSVPQEEISLTEEHLSEEEALAEKELTQQEETPTTEEGIPGGESSLEEGTIPEEVIPEGESTPEKEDIPEEGSVPEKEEFRRKKVFGKETDPKKENIPEAAAPETEKSSEQQEEKEEVSKLQEIAQGFDIDFYIIIGGEKVKLQNNRITGIATWKDGRTTYHGISVDDLVSVYEEFGFTRGNDGQNPDAYHKFVSAYRGKRE